MEDPVASIRFVDAVCARAAMVGEDVGVIAVVGAGRRGWWLPVTSCAPLDRIRVCVGGEVGLGQPRD